MCNQLSLVEIKEKIKKINKKNVLNDDSVFLLRM